MHNHEVGDEPDFNSEFNYKEDQEKNIKERTATLNQSTNSTGNQKEVRLVRVSEERLNKSVLLQQSGERTRNNRRVTQLHTTNSCSLDNSAIIEGNMILGALNNGNTQTIDGDRERDMSSSSFLKSQNDQKDITRETKSSSGIQLNSKRDSNVTTPLKRDFETNKEEEFKTESVVINVKQTVAEIIDETPINVKMTFEELLEQQLIKE